MGIRGARRHAVGRAVAFVSLVGIAFATLVPQPGNPDVLHLCVLCGALSGVDSLLNVLLFVPFGVGLALSGAPALAAIAVMCGVSLSIETLQFVALAGRHASVGDVVMNSVGGAIGFLIGRRGVMLTRPNGSHALALAAGWMVLWVALQALVAYSLLPVSADLPWHSHVGRPHSRSGVKFPGRVLAATFGGESIFVGRVQGAGAFKSKLDAHQAVPLRARILANGSSPGRSEIVVVSSPDGGIASLEQDGNDLVFGVRNGADALLLRPFEFRVREVFGSPSTTLSDTLELLGRYERSEVTLVARSRTNAVERRFTARLSSGWRLFMPRPTYIEGDPRDTVMSAAYMALVLAPAGYWTGRSAAPGGATHRRYRLTILLGAFALLTGMAVVPATLGLRPAAMHEWGYAATGLLLGALLARAVSRSVVSTQSP
jgi:hypothetical protein